MKLAHMKRINSFNRKTFLNYCFKVCKCILEK